MCGGVLHFETLCEKGVKKTSHFPSPPKNKAWLPGLSGCNELVNTISFFFFFFVHYTYLIFITFARCVVSVMALSCPIARCSVWNHFFIIFEKGNLPPFVAIASASWKSFLVRCTWSSRPLCVLFIRFFIPFCKTPLFFKLQAVVVSLWWRIRSSWEKRQFSFSFLRFSNSCGWLRPIASEEYNTDNKAERIENGVNGLVFLFLLEREWKAAVAFLNLQYVSSFVLNICRLSLYH